MANRETHEAKSLDRFITTLFGVVTIGAGPAIASQSCLGFTVTRTGAGEFTITLEDQWATLLGCGIQVFHATPADLKPFLVSETVATTKLITFQLLAVATATDLADGGKLFIQIDVRNSSTPRKGV